MQSKSSVILKILLNSFHPGPPQSLLKKLPQEEAKEVLSLEIATKNPALALSWPSEAIARTHYSWLAPIIEQMPKSIRSSLIASLPEPQSTGLKKLLKIPPFAGIIPDAIKTFLRGQLYLRWQPAEAVPPDFLLESPLKVLLSISKADLVELIDFLGIYDLADGIRHVVDKNKLKQIYLCLTPQQQQYLRHCLHKKEKVASPKLLIEKWDGSHEQLNHILHRRGMLRLGKAISGQGRHFLWHIVHTLDTGRGQAVAEHYQDDEIPGISHFLAQQAISTLNFLKPKSNA